MNMRAKNSCNVHGSFVARTLFSLPLLLLLLQWTQFMISNTRDTAHKHMCLCVSRSYTANNVPLKYHLICRAYLSAHLYNALVLWFGVRQRNGKTQSTDLFGYTRVGWLAEPGWLLCAFVVAQFSFRLDKLYAFVCCSIFRFIFYETTNFRICYTLHA